MDKFEINPFTVIGTSGRSHCPTSVKKWKFPEGKHSILMLEEKPINISCGSEWSEWSGTENNKCGDRFQYRKRVDTYGITETDTRNIGYENITVIYF